MLFAVMAVLLTASVVRAQDNGTIEFPENSKDPVATFSADDPEDDTYSVVVTGTDPEAEGPAVTYHKVVVKVTNVDEDGMVTWTVDPDGGPDHEPITAGPDKLLQFQAGASLMASVTDGDLSGADKTVENVIWRWYRSPTNSSTGGTLIEGANSDTYQVQDKTGSDDVGMYLRAEASYTDGSGPVVTASRVSDYPVQAFRTNNDAPNFGPDTSTARSVNEGPMGMMVGAPVTRHRRQRRRPQLHPVR